MAFLGGGTDLNIDLNRLYVYISVCVSIDVLLELDRTICFEMLGGFSVITNQ